MTSIKEKLEAMGLELPSDAFPAANYVPFVKTGSMVFISGQIPMINGEKHFIGKVGQDFSIEDGQKAAQMCALNILAHLNTAVGGDITKIKRCVKLGGFVNCVPDFDQQPVVINGASDVIAGVLGDAGKHARFAVGAPSLPFNVAVEVDAVFEIEA